MPGGCNAEVDFRTVLKKDDDVCLPRLHTQFVAKIPEHVAKVDQARMSSRCHVIFESSNPEVQPFFSERIDSINLYVRLVSPEAGAHVCRPVVDLGVVSVFTHLVLQKILRIGADLTEYTYVTYSVVLPDQKSRFQAGFRADSNRAGMLIFKLSRNPVRKLCFLAGGGCVYATVCGPLFGQHVRRRSFEVQGPAVHEVRAWASLGLRKPAAQLEVKRVSCRPHTHGFINMSAARQAPQLLR